MITGISNEMLIGKPTFEDIRDRVREFIGDAIIVGHNVLFDIAMLRSHGIDLEKNIVIDTFELSEIFSQDVESLNLGFLANRYNLINPEEEEHRALTDTKISMRLFTHYLKEVRLLDDEKYAIWEMLRERDRSHTLHTISKICHTNTESRLSVDAIIHSRKREKIRI
jgi:DNA polymerase III epsilon subunit-like protein